MKIIIYLILFWVKKKATNNAVERIFYRIGILKIESKILFL